MMVIMASVVVVVAITSVSYWLSVVAIDWASVAVVIAENFFGVDRASA